MMATPALVVFARVPGAGAVKTRLTPRLSPEDAARLYGAFVADALDAWSESGAWAEAPSVRVYFTPESGSWPEYLTPAGVSVHPQRGDGLGPRMLRAALETFAAGHDRVVIVGTDHPTLPLAFLEEAFRALKQPNTVVIGPAHDGGYYLLGLNEVVPSLFEGLIYGHPRVFSEVLARAAGAGTRPVLLPPWYDVDTPADLERLIAERAAGADVGPRTAAALDSLGGASSAQGGSARRFRIDGGGLAPSR